ncbi:MAG: hypothetical protein IPL60_04100 [Ardenticatenia bacterium]|nr:hypothetical protein [Ardenticatenia bacterium]
MKPQRLRPAAEPAAIVPSSAVPTSTFAELITIGSELLLGETVDTNAAHVARALGAAGIPLRRKVSVADDVAVIAAEVAAAAGRAPIVLTTGGLGPTQDDPTREAVARATGRALEFRPELWAQVKARFRAFGRIRRRTTASRPTYRRERSRWRTRWARPRPSSWTWGMR